MWLCCGNVLVWNSHTEQELGLPEHMALLSPTDNQMMNRISSSIIRELSSNMLIPYSRLKLLECVGQGMMLRDIVLFLFTQKYNHRRVWCCIQGTTH